MTLPVNCDKKLDGVGRRALYPLSYGDFRRAHEARSGQPIHLDEWVSSPIYGGSTQRLRSGMAIQVDVIPATNTPYHTTNIEDGIALADETLRQSFEDTYPDAWTRIQQRRAFMRDCLGIRLKPEVLPFSNIPAYLPPFWLSPQKAMRLA